MGYFIWRLAKPLYIHFIASDDDINTLVLAYLATQILLACLGGGVGYWQFIRLDLKNTKEPRKGQ